MFIPVGGLANRMRAVSSAVTLAQKTNTTIDIVWFQDWALHAPFKTLFCPINIQNAHLREATLTDHILYDRPRKRNMNIPLFFKRYYSKPVFMKNLLLLYANSSLTLSIGYDKGMSIWPLTPIF